MNSDSQDTLKSTSHFFQKMVKPEIKSRLKFLPLAKSNWNDFEHLFGERGACGGCWCMTWRFTAAEYEKKKGQGNKNAMKKIVNSNEPVGIIGYVDGEPAGWCAVAPREKFIRLENSRVLKRFDDKPVWSITCFFIAKPFRRKGLSTELIKATLDYCRKQKVKTVEAYPVEPRKETMPEVFAWTGFSSAFLKAGFREVVRFSPTRPILRYELK